VAVASAPAAGWADLYFCKARQLGLEPAPATALPFPDEDLESELAVWPVRPASKSIIQSSIGIEEGRSIYSYKDYHTISSSAELNELLSLDGSALDQHDLLQLLLCIGVLLIVNSHQLNT